MVALPLSEPGGVSPTIEEARPLAWALHDGKAGMASQSLGLAEATGFSFVEKRLSVHPPWRWLPPRLWAAPLRAVSCDGAPLAPPWPDLVVACGRNSAMPALAVRRASGGICIAVQIQDPRVGSSEFDLMLVPAHDRLRGRDVLVTTGAIHRVTPARLAAERRRFPLLETLPRPIVGVLIGGSNRAYRLSLHRLGEIADRIAASVRETGGSVLVTPSRRTGTAGIALMRERLAEVPAVIWDGSGDNPYYAYLAIADTLLVTADSVSMVSEAAATGKPLYILDLGAGDRKFSRFHANLHAAGITRPFTGRFDTWSYTPPDDTARAGAAVRAAVLANRQRRAPC